MYFYHFIKFLTLCLQKYEEYLKQKNKYKKKVPISVKIHR